MKKPYTTEPGAPMPMGASRTPDGINFALFSRHAEQVTLVLYDSATGNPAVELVLDPAHHKTGDIWHVLVRTKKHNLHYCYRVAGPNESTANGHFFNDATSLLDPYAKALSGGEKWGENGEPSGFRRRCLLMDDHFDWQEDRPLNIPLKDSIIYELHVRGFTRHHTSKVRHTGTFAGLIEKIPYLKKLGITAVELMPVNDFNELENIRRNPRTGEKLKNFWGYSSLAFFAPKAAYAASSTDGNQVREFKQMVKALHQAGIEVILDVVFNHTAEGGQDGPVISFRGLDNTIYYLLDHETRDYLNFSGCGNTLNCNHPLVRQFIIDCLHYWVIEMHVDGFRFDLASILGRDRNGEVLSNPPMVEIIAEDPILAETKIIAEAWDAAGLYQVGSFSTSARWAEWNGLFRDEVRAFMNGRQNSVPTLATRIAGSADLYQRGSHQPSNSINFITSHDGFTLYDLVSYNTKHNLENGEQNRDGSDHNISWNNGHEGETSNSKIQKLRARRMRTMAAILFLSQGVPMFVAGDEFGRTQKGNNNAYCQDNEISWLDWRLTKKNHGLLRYFRLLIHLRKRHPIFRRSTFFPPASEGSRPEITWQAERPGRQNWSADCKILAFFLDGRTGETKDDDFFVMLNGHRRKTRTFEAPPPSRGRKWLKIIDTAAPSPHDIIPEDETSFAIEPGQKITVAPMAAVVLISKPGPGKTA